MLATQTRRLVFQHPKPTEMKFQPQKVQKRILRKSLLKKLSKPWGELRNFASKKKSVRVL